MLKWTSFGSFKGPIIRARYTQMVQVHCKFKRARITQKWQLLNVLDFCLMAMNELFPCHIYLFPSILLFKHNNASSKGTKILAYKSPLKILKNQRKVAKSVTSLPGAINPNQGH